MKLLVKFRLHLWFDQMVLNSLKKLSRNSLLNRWFTTRDCIRCTLFMQFLSLLQERF
ncbi:hypothetical protein Gorai_024142 [Gossypium raimondii]|uniref:Uncharacterized protein n=1 Tax=Gossypium raimondii TaxID=29730 RepID=A0A7J8NYM3_GOSRA|nr:hypothetical protein [Gossypium raimondii]